MLCSYGCNKEALFQLKNKKWCCSSNVAKCTEMRRKNSVGVKKSCIDRIDWWIIKGVPHPKKNGYTDKFKGVSNIDRYGLEKAKLISDKMSESKIGHSFNITLENEIIRRQKISATMLKNKRCGGYRHGSGIGKKGWYKGYWCDSSWELAWVIYNIEHNILFERNHIGFEYVYNNCSYKYYPDFKINNTYYEIKAFLRENDQ